MESMAEAQAVNPPLPELILSLEQAALMAKQLPTTTDPTHLFQIYSSLHETHHHLSTFLSRTTPLFPQPLPLAPPAENSLSSATGAVAGGDNGNEPMQVGDDDGYDEDNDDDIGEGNSKGNTIDRVEEKMRDCFIKNKRPKRPLSPSAAALVEERRLNDGGFIGGFMGFDPHATRLKALDLVYQFHG